MHSKKVFFRGLLIIFSILGISLLFLSVPQISFALVLYDDFSTTSINEDKWQQSEWAREIQGGQLRIKLRSTINTTEVAQGNLTFQNPASINSVEAKVTPQAFNNTSGARVTAAYIMGRFFNDGTGSPGQYTGDILAQIVIGGSGTSPVAFWSVYRYTHPTDPNQQVLIDDGNFSLPLILGTQYTLTMAWNGTQFTFKISDGNTTQEQNFAPGLTVTEARMPLKLFGSRISGNAGREATVEALFDDIKINGSPDVYEDFTGDTIDSAKWTYYDVVRDVDNGEIRLKRRTSTADTGVLSSIGLELTNPGLIKAMQAQVTPLTYNNPNGVDAKAGISGRYYNDGTLNDWVGDIIAGVGIGGTATNPVASWAITRHTDSTDTNITEIVDTGDFSTPITLGTPYTLYISWDGASFVFKVNDETLNYTPTTAIHPPNHPMRRLQARMRTPGGQESFIEAKYDDVMIEWATFQGTVGTQITLNDTGYGTKKGSVKVGGKTCKIIGEWTADSITCEIKTALSPAIPYDIVVKPKEPKGALQITYTAAFTMMAPEIASVVPDSGSNPNEIVISGKYFGTKKGKVYFEYEQGGKIKKKTCKITEWRMDDPVNGDSHIKFTVPKTSSKFLPNTYTLKVWNKVGEDSTTFEVE